MIEPSLENPHPEDAGPHAILFFDTETTGLPVPNLGLGAEVQPHLVELAMILYDVKGDEISSYSALLVKAEGWNIHPKAEAAHGLSKEYLNRWGFPENFVVRIFWEYLQKADLLVCHNVKFDLQIMQTALARYGQPDNMKTLMHKRTYCTMLEGTEVCQVSPTDKQALAGRYGWKPPKLEEAYNILTGKTLEDAHRAMADTRATLEVWRVLTKRQPRFEPLRPTLSFQ